MTTSATTSTLLPKRARAPGKIILSGEHSVVYGAPALAMAVERYTEVWFTPIHKSEGLRTAFENLSQGQFYPLDVLKGFKQGLDRRFDKFMRGELPVQQILQRPEDLAVYSLASFLQQMPVPGVSGTHRLPVPGQLSSRSDLPLGGGMGSSASVIAATFVLYEHLLSHAQSLKERFERVRFCERLQHGKGSAVDAATVVYGGLNRVQEGAVTPIDLSASKSDWPGQGWYWVLHGIPASSTGECVADVRKRHGKDRDLWRAFGECTAALDTALTTGTLPTEVIRQNHSLLQRIGVVPAAAAGFIDAVEAMGGGAKICGAGSIRGDSGGVILVQVQDPDAMTALMRRYPDCKWDALRMAKEGAHMHVAEDQP